MLNFFGHEKQWQLLQKSVKSGKLSHAYLFSGKSQLAKREVAKEFIGLLSCQSKSFENKPCQQCQSCQEMKKGCHPDLLWLEAKEETGESEIGSIRNLANWLHLKPGLGKHRLAVVNQIQSFSLPAQSALLKTLEEPKGEAILILISDYPEFLLDTIISRVQEIKFHCLSDKRIIDFLLSKNVDPKLAKRISCLSLGKPLKALSLLDSGQMKSEEKRIMAFKRMLKKDLVFSFKEIEKTVEEKETLLSGLETWLNVLRIIFLERIGVIKEDIMDREEQIALPNLKNLMISLEKANYLLMKTNANKRLILENSILELY
ncbi:hypothetical protein L6250_01425 [Candidatus Parcubacteria bacterium]|nr:hypothetical protein [Patescibacteria group bacterium]MBU4466901.1 hypothetical protein [Patescibacteria group bacterium]MCG2688276.1 hypothetical protein [Candidatus Parcubacteria bacterium]